MDAAAICAGFTDDVEVLCAAVLHDSIEDAVAAVGEIEGRFGARVTSIVAGDSEVKRGGVPAAEAWKARKVESIEHRPRRTSRWRPRRRRRGETPLR